MPCGTIPKTTYMPNYSRNEVILVRYPFSNLGGSKVRPAVVVNATHVSQDVIIVALTSKVSSLLAGEFVLSDWQQAGLNVASAVKRGLYTVHESLVAKSVGELSVADASALKKTLRDWLGLH
jgi:PemK-like, MazF-like toxin of type II toxin-antitoxin system